MPTSLDCHGYILTRPHVSFMYWHYIIIPFVIEQTYCHLWYPHQAKFSWRSRSCSWFVVLCLFVSMLWLCLISTRARTLVLHAPHQTPFSIPTQHLLNPGRIPTFPTVATPPQLLQLPIQSCLQATYPHFIHSFSSNYIIRFILTYALNTLLFLL